MANINSDIPSHLLVTVRPHQSAYFAGERFQCTIHFKNTLSPSTSDPSSPLPFSHHARSTSSSRLPQLPTPVSTPTPSSSAFSSTSSFASTPRQSLSYSQSASSSRLYLNQPHPIYPPLPQRMGLVGSVPTSDPPRLRHLKSYSISTITSADPTHIGSHDHSGLPIFTASRLSRSATQRQ